jgi:hypothetical protein
MMPIFMSAFATVLAAPPKVDRRRQEGHEIEHFIAVGILGWLRRSAVLNVFVILAVCEGSSLGVTSPIIHLLALSW